ncbi:uncharacterized protein [Phyllobates terribilis]|uniref:uncharacterized protein n=1 Tax=Phyllobates terribilis TaxID=111132 RepID=UPI003CCAEB57
MEKALTTMSSIKVGSLWISKKAQQEIAHLPADLSSITSTVEKKAKWVFSKLKGKTQKELAEFLRDYNLPAGIFPSNIIGYEFDESTSKLVVHMSSPCESSFKDSSVLRYSNRVKATVSRGKLSGIEGMKTKVIVWVKITSISLETYKSDKLWFTAGVNKCRAKDVYDFPKLATKVDEF